MTRSFAPWLVMASVIALAGCPVTPPPTDAAPSSDAGGCTSNPQCDDGLYCNGSETCVSGRCTPGETPCMPTQQCIAAEGRCVTACAIQPDADGDGVPSVVCGGLDCDDADPNRFPTNPEVCDDASHDEDCLPTTFGLRDRDGDGEVDAACCNVDPTTHASICGTDCADERRDVHGGLAESCDGIDNDCDGMTDETVTRMGAPDHDFDLHGDSAMRVAGCPGDPGFSSVTDDCNDASPAAFGSQLEICDAMDNNCNGLADEVMGQLAWYPDDDGDGFGGSDAARIQISCAPVAGFTTRAGDCDDAHSDVHPGATERCNGLDDDCNGRADYRIAAGNTEDDDGDGAADLRCGGDDCDDANAAVRPGAPELADALDDDCNGMIDDSPTSVGWYLDLDRDGYGSGAPISSSSPITGRVTRAGDCDDGDVYVHPGVADPCDGIDQDCDTRLDESAPLLAFFPDADHDGWASSSVSAVMLACRAPAGLAGNLGDCDDATDTRHPLAPELCNGADDDCDASVDETPASTWYVDLDGDGWGNEPGIASCTAISGRVTMGGDCDDTNATRHPMQQELCNGADDDCDASIDETAELACMGPHATSAACTSGACVLTCATGYHDCDASPTTGCEIDTAHNAASCGACFMPCPLGDTCGRSSVAGTCDAAPVLELDSGDGAVFAQRTTGGVVVWGDGAAGSLSIASAGHQPSPTLAGMSDVLQVVAFAGGGCALLRSGQVACWGSFDFWGTAAAGPIAIALPLPATRVCAASSHACAVLADHTLRCWGRNSSGELGNGGGPSIVTPVQGRDASGFVTDVVDVSCSTLGTCVMREHPGGDRYVSCVGSNDNGALGMGGPTGPTAAFDGIVVMLPTDLVAFHRGAAHGSTCVRTLSGRAYCWGADDHAMLGLGTGAPLGQPTPATPAGLEAGVVDLVLAPDNAFGGCAIRAVGASREALCWGTEPITTRAVGFTGDGTLGPETSVDIPTSIGTPADRIRDAVSIVRGSDETCVVRSSGGVWCTGYDARGQLGDGPTDSTGATFVRVAGLP